MFHHCLTAFLITVTASVAHAGPDLRFSDPGPGESTITVLRGTETLLTYHVAGTGPKPCFYPVRGLDGQELTSQIHPVDPKGHRHHRSIWVGHRDVNGQNFWEENDGTSIRVAATPQDSRDPQSWSAVHHWCGKDGAVLAEEVRSFRLIPRLPEGYGLDITLVFAAPSGQPLQFGKTPFGFLGVRLADPIHVKDGAGRVLNSAGQRNEAGTHWQPAKWVDYSLARDAGAGRGIALFDHPANPGFPNIFHVRDDGWMGPSVTYRDVLTVAPGETIRFRYRLYFHGVLADSAALESVWESFSR